MQKMIVKNREESVTAALPASVRAEHLLGLRVDLPRLPPTTI